MRVALIFIFLIGYSFLSTAQTGIVTGKVVDKTNKGFPNIHILLKKNPAIQTTTNLDGIYQLEVPTGAQTIIIQFNGEKRAIDINVIEGQTIKAKKVRLPIQYYESINILGQSKDRSIRELPSIDINQIPGPKSSVEKYLTLTTAATSNNELTNNYNVRGGSYDENLIYVNGFKIYRPFLTRSGQQEGMSFINPNLVQDIYFSAGGFAANYGDRLSSVLDITYRTPTEFRGSFNASIMGVTAHVEDQLGSRFTYMFAGRYHDKSYLLNSLPIKGTYQPKFYDFQLLTKFYIQENIVWNVLGYYSSNSYSFSPVTQETKIGTVQQPLNFKVYFEGGEETHFRSITGATSLKWEVNKRTNLALYAKIFNTDERETFDVLGEYFINKLEKDPAKESYGDSIGTIGVGAYLNHARNRLLATVYSTRIEGAYQFLAIEEDGYNYKKKGKIEWGLSAQYEDFHGKISEWGYVDSAGFSQPQGDPNTVDLHNVVKAENTLLTWRTSGYLLYKRNFNHYLQNYPIAIKTKKVDSLGEKIKYTYYDTIPSSRSQFSLNMGVRGGYTAFNEEFYLTPRAIVSYYPRKYYLNNKGQLKRRYLRLHASVGMYYQPPFYRELRRFNGKLYTNTKSQKSLHVVAGIDYDFEMWQRETPFTLSGEIFYKYLWDVNPYYLDNLRLRYFADNIAVGRAYGFDFHLHGEFINGIQSFFKIGLLRSVEDLKNDDYYTYTNSDGEEIIPGYTFNDTPVDSTLHSPGFIPKPTDQWINFATLFQDRMPGIEQFTVQVGLNFGSKLPYGPPGHKRYKDTLRRKAYFRVDIGFGYDFLYNKPKEERSKFFQFFEDIRLEFEVFNLLGIKNVLSHQWVLATQGRYLAVPNYLTQRRFNLKLIVKW